MQIGIGNWNWQHFHIGNIHLALRATTEAGHVGYRCAVWLRLPAIRPGGKPPPSAGRRNQPSAQPPCPDTEARLWRDTEIRGTPFAWVLPGNGNRLSGIGSWATALPLIAGTRDACPYRFRISVSRFRIHVNHLTTKSNNQTIQTIKQSHSLPYSRFLVSHKVHIAHIAFVLFVFFVAKTDSTAPR